MPRWSSTSMRARVQAAGARAGELLAGAPLDDRDVDARQRQLARQHQPGRAASGDHHRMLRHSDVLEEVDAEVVQRLGAPRSSAA